MSKKQTSFYTTDWIAGVVSAQCVTAEDWTNYVVNNN